MKTKLCAECGAEFMPNNNAQKYCLKCRSENVINRVCQRKRKAEEDKVELKQYMKKIGQTETIRKTISKMMEYNKANGTNLSYGQFVARRG